MTPRIQAFFDHSTSTVSYVVYQAYGSACAVIDPVLDYDAHSGRTSTGSADQVIVTVQRAFAAVFPLHPGKFDHLFAPDETFKTGNMEARALHVPGHTPADIAYLVGDTVFIGDTFGEAEFVAHRAR